jgi:hypothetical protein
MGASLEFVALESALADGDSDRPHPVSKTTARKQMNDNAAATRKILLSTPATQRCYRCSSTM